MLIWDDFRAHKTERVKHCADQTCNTDLVIIPGGCTSILQAPDISWNKPFKGKYTELWNEWSARGEKTYTPTGNTRDPPRETCVRWVKESWAFVTKETILRSFKYAGITTDIGGAEDALMTCMKDETLAYEIKTQLYNDQEMEEIEHADIAAKQEGGEQLDILEDSDSDFYGFNADDLL